MARQPWIADVLADAFRGVKGFQVEVYPGFSTRGSTAFAPIGVMNHHTGPGGYDNLLNYMMRGSKIAPLCNWATSRPHNGVVRVTVCSAGRANHAGRGGSGRGGTDWIPTDSGNRLTIGGEHQNDGGQPWDTQQLEAVHRGSAAMLKHLRQNESRACMHKTYAPGRKPDPHTVTLASSQREIHRFLAGNEPHKEDDVLKRGDSGNEVTVLQWRINQFFHGKADPRKGGEEHGLIVDGDFGENTEAYVREVQNQLGYETSGVYNLPTAIRLLERLIQKGIFKPEG